MFDEIHTEHLTSISLYTAGFDRQLNTIVKRLQRKGLYRI